MDEIEVGINKTLVSVDRVLPPKLSVIPMKRRPIFPGILMPLVIGKNKYIKTIKKIIGIDGFIGLILIKNSEANKDREENFYQVGTIGKVIKTINLPDGQINIFVNTIKRFEVKKFLSMDPYVTAAVNYIDVKPEMDKELQALVRTLYLEIKEVSEDNPFFTEEIKLNIANLDGAEKVVDFVSSILNVGKEVQQDILETFDVKKRVEKVLNLLHKEKELLKLQKKIQEQITEKVTKQQV
ncbi:Lon protease [subsurface metagenome]